LPLLQFLKLSHICVLILKLRQMKRLFSSIVCMVLISSVFAGPGWERVNYRNSTIFTGIITLDGKAVKAGDMVGAFSGKECRMIATVFTNNDSTYVSSVIHGETAEDISFKLWIKGEDKIYDLKSTMKSNPGESIYLYKLPFSSKK